LNNKGPQPLDIQPTLFSLDGQRLDVPPVTVDGTSFRVIDLRQWAVLGAGFDEGSLQIVHYGMDMQLGAQVKIIDAEHSLIHDEQLMANMAMSSRLEGVWWLRSHQCDVRLVLSNVTDSSLTATVAVDGVNPAQASPARINLAAHETRLINPEELARNGKGTLREIGGISIIYGGAPGSLLAHGLIDELSIGFSSSIEFWDPSMAHSSKLDGGGLRLGLAGGKELTPVVVARNIGTTESIVSGSVSYTAADSSTSVVRVPDTRLRPGEVDAIDVSRTLRSSRIDTEHLVSAGLQFTYSSVPGSIVISAQSLSADGNQVFRLPLVDADAQPSSTGGYPWFINGSSSTVVYITNVTDEPQQYVLQLNFQGGVHAPGLKTVAPHQTAVLDIRALRDGQVKDEHNQTIPPDATHGQVQWSIEGPENLTLIGRAEQGDSLNGMSSSYACVNCCPASCINTWIDPPSVTGFSGDTQQFTGFQQNEDCFGNLLSPFSHSATWSSTNSSVATVNSTGVATAQNPGSTNIQGTWTAFLWDLNPNNTCTKTTFQPLADALCDVLGVSISGAQSVQDGSFFAPTFTLTPQGATPISYQWSWSTPPGVGNNPLVTFNPSNGATTTTNRRWFANPNVACPSPPSVHNPPVSTDPYYNSVYTIRGQANFSGGSAHQDTTLTVNNYWFPAGATAPPVISGGPTIGFNNNSNLWVVVNSGTITRNTPVTVIYVPIDSQFYNKTVIHENRHVQQFVSGMNSDTFTVASLMAQLSPLTDSTQAGLNAKIVQAFNDWYLGQVVSVNLRILAMEQDAHSISDIVIPQYAYQLCQ
jgi:hypothetical protein